jgi:hypothetical protein
MLLLAFELLRGLAERAATRAARVEELRAVKSRRSLEFPAGNDPEAHFIIPNMSYSRYF